MLLPDIVEGWFEVEFLIDTGAAATCLHSTDAVRVAGIEPAVLRDEGRWPRADFYTGVGGRARYFIAPATYSFVTDDHHQHVVNGEIRVEQLRSGAPKLPSLLGRDILEQFELVLDWRSRRVELR